MYLEKLSIKNVGPISSLSIEMPFEENKNPKPLIIVGENGTGKTILLSQIMDSFYEIAQQIFSDIGNYSSLRRPYYKISGGRNLKTGQNNCFSLLRFIDDNNNKIDYFDKVGNVKKEDFCECIKNFSLSPYNKNSPQKETTLTIMHSIVVDKEKIKDEWLNGVYFYQPAYRYEEPFWKNKKFYDNQRFQDEIRFDGTLNKEIEIISSTRENKDYLMDLVLDLSNTGSEKDRKTWNNVNSVLNKIMQKENIRFGIGPRGGYRVAIVDNKREILLPSIDNLSLGESTLLNLFMNIIRHGDSPPKDASEIKGIVVIDEIDVHLHTNLQYNVLPSLIKYFPKIQFIITTHSPLFILGMEKEFKENEFEIRNMPNGEKIISERFSEFENAYKVLRDTSKYEEDLKKKIKEANKSVVFVEGKLDVEYIKTAAKLLEKECITNNLCFIEAGGKDSLKKVWDNKKVLSNVIKHNIILLYDCDVNVKKESEPKSKVFKERIPLIEENYLKKGIENLFPKKTICEVIKNKPSFIDIKGKCCETIRGKKKSIEKKYEVNKDEKRNLCEFLCNNGKKEDFENFEKIFEILKKYLPKKVNK